MWKSHLFMIISFRPVCKFGMEIPDFDAWTAGQELNQLQVIGRLKVAGGRADSGVKVAIAAEPRCVAPRGSPRNLTPQLRFREISEPAQCEPLEATGLSGARWGFPGRDLSVGRCCASEIWPHALTTTWSQQRVQILSECT